jgi:hypothetical protein
MQLIVVRPVLTADLDEWLAPRERGVEQCVQRVGEDALDLIRRRHKRIQNGGVREQRHHGRDPELV